MTHAASQGREGVKLRRRNGRRREHLTTFVTGREVPPTNSVSKHCLRASVVLRNVTYGFHAE